MVKPFFSIIIPTLNEEEVLPLLLGDLKQQTFTSLETIVVDGKSKDATVQIVKTAIKDFPTPLQLLRVTKSNVSIQRNQGGTVASGTWVVFLDADTRLEATFFEELKEQLVENPCDAFTPYAEADIDDTQSKLFITLQNMLLDSMTTMGIPYAIGACMGCKKNIFEEIGGFDASINHMEDSEFARRVKDSGYKFKVLQNPKFIYSLRRQRQEGALSIIAKSFPYYIQSAITKQYKTPAKLYPMKGGSMFKKDSHG